MKKPQKKLFLGLMMLLLIPLLLGSFFFTSSADTIYKWKLGTIYVDPATNSNYNSLGMAGQKFIELVKEKTKGRVIITPYWNSLLGDNPTMFEQIKSGDIEVFYGQPMASADKRFGAWNIPYLFKDLDDIEKVNAVPNGPMYKLSASWMKDNKGMLLAVGAANLRGFANAKHPVVKPADLKDLKVRTYEDPVVGIFWNPICIASPLAMSETYSALQTKTVDGLEFPPTSMVGRKFYEVTKYYTDLNWQWASGANIVVSDKYWNELPADLKKLVQQAAVEAMRYQGKVEKENIQLAINMLKSKGMEIHMLSASERKEWMKYARILDDKIRQAIGAQAFNDVLKAVKSVQK